MDALSVRSHFRLAAVFEWLVAAAFLLGKNLKPVAEHICRAPQS